MTTPRRPSAAARPAALALALVLSSTSASAEALARTRPEDVGLSSARLQRLTDAFQKYTGDGKLAGAVVLVARHGKIAYLHSFGSRDVESKAPMKDDAIFRIASQSKALTSVAALRLQEEG